MREMHANWRRYAMRFAQSAISVFLIFSSLSWANPMTDFPPERISGVKTISAEMLAALLISESPPVLIDSRISKGRHSGSIEGARPLPDNETSCASLKRVAPDDRRPVVFYCGSDKCGRSVNPLRVAQNCGYSNLIWFRGGFKEWLDAGFPFIPAHQTTPF